MKISKYDFSFRLVGFGIYEVLYVSPITHKVYGGVINDMSLIDCTKNSDKPKTMHLNELKRVCKRLQKEHDRIF